VLDAKRFWARIDMRDFDGHWTWRVFASVTGARPPRVSVNGTQQRAARHAWVLINGPVPAGMRVYVACGLGSCCNPAHMELHDTQKSIHI
jgi:hypothetical protein